jgi:hypothetical protein
MSELGRDARELIERALRDEESADGVELARIRRRVLAAGASASVLGSAGKALAVLGKASVGPILKAFGLGLALTVLALGIPTVLSKERPNRRVREPAHVQATPARPAQKNAAPTAEQPAVTPAAPVPPRSPVRANASPQLSAQAPHVQAPVAAGEPEVHAPSAEVLAPRTEFAPPANATTPRAASSPPSNETYSTPRALTPPKPSTLVQELALLEKVQSELRAGHGAAALRLLDQSTPPQGGQLQAERLAAEVFAACQMGDVARARASARAFLSRYASSPASARVRGSCAGEQVENAR